MIISLESTIWYWRRLTLFFEGPVSERRVPAYDTQTWQLVQEMSDTVSSVAVADKWAAYLTYEWVCMTQELSEMTHNIQAVPIWVSEV